MAAWSRRGAARPIAGTPTTRWISPASVACCRPPAGRSTPAFVSPDLARRDDAGSVRRCGCCSCAPATARAPRWPRRWRRARSGGAVEAYSAGSHPKPLHPNAVRVMRDEHGLDLAGHASKHLDVFADQRFDWVISLCDRVREVCPEFPGHPETIHWSIPNPATGEPTTTPPTRCSSRRPPSWRPASGSCSPRSPIEAPDPESQGEAMTDRSEMVSVRYMVDDVDEGRRLLHEVPRLRSSDELPSRLRRRRPRQPAAAAQRTDQLRGAAHAGWRQAGTRRLEPHPPDRRRHRCRSRPPARRRCSVPQRHPRRARAASRSCSKTPPATSSSSSSPPPHRFADRAPRKETRWRNRHYRPGRCWRAAPWPVRCT